MNESSSLGTIITQLRRDANMTQADLAERLGITAQAISQWERSETMPDILTLPLLAEIFSCSIDALFHPKMKREPLSPNDGTWRAVLMHGNQIVTQTEIPDKIQKKVSLEINGAIAGNVYSDFPIVVRGAISGKVTSDSVVTIVDSSKAEVQHQHITIDKPKNAVVHLTQPSQYEAVLMCNGKVVDVQSVPETGERVELHITGDTGEIQSAFSVHVSGEVNGDIHCTTLTANSDINGDVDCDDLTVDGDISGDVDCDDLTVGGSIGGDVDCGDLTVSGSIGGDVDCSTATISGNVRGSIDATEVTVYGNADGDIDAEIVYQKK